MRILARLGVLSALIAFALVGMAHPGLAQEDAEPTTPPVEISEPDEGDSPVGDIIPKPNSGRAPTDPGDRGGALQLILLALIVGFFALAAFSIRRQVLAARSSAATPPHPDPEARQNEPRQQV